MAYTVVDSVSAGDFGKAAQWNQMRTNQEHFKGSIDAATGEIETDKVTAASIAAGAVGQSEIAASAVGQSELKITEQTHSWDTTTLPTGTHIFWTGGIFSHLPTCAHNLNTGANITGVTIQTANGLTIVAGTWTRQFPTYVAAATAVPAAGRNFYLYSMYHSASPPWRFLGFEDYGMFMFSIVTKDGIRKHSHLCVDPPWENGPPLMDKNSEGRISLMPHPFAYDKLEPGDEIVLYDLRSMQDIRPVSISDEAAEVAAEMEADNGGIKVEVAASLTTSTEPRKMTGMERLVLRSRMRGLPVANELLSGGGSIVDRSTRCLSDDKSHQDHKHLPQMPGIFIPDTDGTPPLVRVMTQP